MKFTEPLVPPALLGLALGALISLSPSSAAACSPPYMYPGDPCDAVRVWVPGAVFPLNLADTDVRVMLLSLIHISEPTRQEAISYAVFCL